MTAHLGSDDVRLRCRRPRSRAHGRRSAENARQSARQVTPQGSAGRRSQQDPCIFTGRSGSDDADLGRLADQDHRGPNSVCPWCPGRPAGTISSAKPLVRRPGGTASGKIRFDTIRFSGGLPREAADAIGLDGHADQGSPATGDHGIITGCVSECDIGSCGFSSSGSSALTSGSTSSSRTRTPLRGKLRGKLPRIAVRLATRAALAPLPQEPRQVSRRFDVTPALYDLRRCLSNDSDSGHHRPAASAARRWWHRRSSTVSDERQITIREGAEICGLSDDTLRRRILDGTIKGATRSGPEANAPWLIPIDELVASGLVRGFRPAWSGESAHQGLASHATNPATDRLVEALSSQVAAQQRLIDSLVAQVDALVQATLDKRAGQR